MFCLKVVADLYDLCAWRCDGQSLFLVGNMFPTRLGRFSADNLSETLSPMEFGLYLSFM